MKCGHEIDGKSPICMYCGAAIPSSSMSPETKERFQNNNGQTQPSSSNSASGVRALGAILLIVGIITDVVSMFMITSGSYGGFSTITIIGTICFLIGLVLFANG